MDRTSATANDAKKQHCLNDMSASHTEAFQVGQQLSSRAENVPRASRGWGMRTGGSDRVATPANTIVAIGSTRLLPLPVLTSSWPSTQTSRDRATPSPSES